MKYFIFGIQRSGTNYLATLIKQNFGPPFRQPGVWKHSIDVPPKYERREPTLVIYKNPYTWVESIAYRKTVDWLKTQNMYPANEIPHEKIFQVGNKNLNLINLMKTWLHFHQTWYVNNLQNTDKCVLIKYEDLLIEEKRIDYLKQIGKKFDWKPKQEGNWRNPGRGNVNQSKDYNNERENYYKQGNPQSLTRVHINKINEILTPQLITRMGYEVL